MRFEYLRPTSVEEAVSLLAQYDGKAKVIAGGTNLVVQMRRKEMSPQYVIDIGGIPGLDYINYDEKQGLRIGALTTIRTLEKSAELRRRYPVISQAASQLGSVAIRNVATLGGNLCDAAPSADTAPGLIGLSAEVRIIGPSGERTALLEDFFTGPGSTILQVGELLAEVQVPVALPNIRSIYLKHGVRGPVDLAVVGAAVIVDWEPKSKVCQDIKIVLGAVAPTPIRARNAEEIIRERKIDDALIDRSAQAASDEARPRSTIRGSAEYKKELIKAYTRRAIREAVAG